MKKYHKILIIIPSLETGGSEKIISFLIDNLKLKHVVIKLCVLGFPNKNHFNIDTSNVIFLNKKRLRNSIKKIFEVVKNENPDLIFTSIYHLNVFSGLLKLVFKKIIFVAREANILSVRNKIKKENILNSNFIIKRIYENLDALIFQSEEMKIDFEKNIIIPKKSFVINNPIIKKHKYISHGQKKLEKINFISVGSLSIKKGHNRLIENLSLINLNFSLKIFGEGKTKNEIKNQIFDLKLNNKILLMGIKKDLTKSFMESNFYIQSSFVEGFPNALLEALSYGLPCLAFNAPGGHNEIIIEGFNGFFYKEHDDFEKVIKKFIFNNWNRKLIKEDVYNRYDSVKILNQYKNVFNTLLK